MFDFFISNQHKMIIKDQFSTLIEFRAWKSIYYFTCLQCRHQLVQFRSRSRHLHPWSKFYFGSFANVGVLFSRAFDQKTWWGKFIDFFVICFKQEKTTDWYYSIKYKLRQDISFILLMYSLWDKASWCNSRNRNEISHFFKQP